MKKIMILMVMLVGIILSAGVVSASVPEDPVIDGDITWLDEPSYDAPHYIVSIVDPENPPQDIEAGIWDILKKNAPCTTNAGFWLAWNPSMVGGIPRG